MALCNIVGRALKRLTWSIPVIFFGIVHEVVADTTFHGFEPGQIYHSIGKRVGAWQWGAKKAVGAGFLTYGPYSSEFQDGAFKARYLLSIDDHSVDDAVVAYIDVFDSLEGHEIARREVHRKEFIGSHSPQPFDLSFATLGKNNLEFRVYVLGKSEVVHWSTTVRRETSLTDHVICSMKRSAVDAKLWERIVFESGKQNSQRPIRFTRSLCYPPAPGNYSARFGLQIEDNSRDDIKVATLVILSRSSGKVLALVNLSKRDFLKAGRMQPFEVPFNYDGRGEVELVVYGFSNTCVAQIYVAINASVPFSMQGSDPRLSHQMGSANGGAWDNDPARGAGFLTYGPYTASVPPGVATASFNLTIDDNRSNNDTVAQVEVHDAGTDKILAHRVIKRHDFSASYAPQEFDLVFELAAVTSLEWRVFVPKFINLMHNSTTVRPDRLTMAALWNQRAHFEYRKRDVFDSNGARDNDTSSLNTLDGIWYAFNREAVSNIKPDQASRCERVARTPLQVVVRESSDRGVTWSEPTVTVAPSPRDSAPDFCEIVDGAAYFDAETDIWHYLGQCLNETSNWNLCHYTREGSSPLGAFTADSLNPVVRGGQLWGEICHKDPSLCPTDTRDEGTPQIIGKDAEGYFYVTFHGAEYAAINTGARGAARTQDFIHWQTMAEGLPGSAMLSTKDCQHWHVKWEAGKCIGEGAGKILRTDGNYYMLAEAADMTLACKRGQTWVFGLLRNSTLGPSGTWRSYSTNPFIVNGNYSPVGCALQYMNLIRDRGDLFLEFSLYTPDYYFPNYLYQLVDGPANSAVMLVK